MIPGLNEIFLCPKCGHPVARQTLTSGNTFGAVYWSDGKMEAPMLPEFPVATRCRQCHAFFFFEDAASPDTDSAPSYSDDNVAANLDWQECRAALLESAAHTYSQENYLRVRLWWSANDRIRHPGAVAPLPCPDSVFRDNLESFIKKLPGTEPTEALARAEALRELGRFAEAEEALRVELPDNYAFARQKISDLVRRRETSVARMS